MLEGSFFSLSFFSLFLKNVEEEASRNATLLNAKMTKTPTATSFTSQKGIRGPGVTIWVLFKRWPETIIGLPDTQTSEFCPSSQADLWTPSPSLSPPKRFPVCSVTVCVCVYVCVCGEWLIVLFAILCDCK